jgi:hypothetical protein
MTGAAYGYNLRSKDKTNVECCDQIISMFESFDESSMVFSTPRLRPSTRYPGRKDMNVDPLEGAFESRLRILGRALMPRYHRCGHRGATRSASPKRNPPLHPWHFKTQEGDGR